MSNLCRDNYKHLFKFATDLWIKPVCQLCQQSLPRYQRICEDCTAHLPWTENMCSYCAQPLAAPHRQCGTCQKNPPAFNQLRIAFDYASPIDQLILSGKFSHRLSHLTLLAELFMQYWRTQAAPLPEVLIPVPLHGKRLRERGYNQALELARIMSRQQGVPIDFTAIKRLKATLAQASLPAHRRLENVRDAFALTKTPLPYTRVALVDDVFTTGNTVRVLSTILRQAGVAHIEIYCIARALHFKF